MKKKSHKVLRCKFCGNGKSFFLDKGKPPHTGIYCEMCGAWIKWGNEDDIRLIKYRKGEKRV